MGRRKKRRQGGIILNKFKIWATMTILGWLFFFSLYLAKWSPVLKFLTDNASIAFGQNWLYIFFALSFLVGILIMVKWYLMNTIIKQFAAIMFLVSAIINFPIVDGISNKYSEFWWYISRPILFLLQQMFGGRTMAVKVFVILLFIWTIIRVAYSLWFSLPKINISHEERPKQKASNQGSANSKHSHDEEEYDDGSSNVVTDQSIKKIIQRTLYNKIEQKERERIQNKPMISFAWEKPTFNVAILDPNVNQKITIDENFFVEKSRWLQDKLMEFNVPISIEWFDVWPSIVQIRIKPEEWIKISTIEWLANDIALSLKSKSLRIVAPIPGTDNIWIQLPNPKPAMVKLWDVIASNEFNQEMKKSDNNLALWKSIDGSVVIKTLDGMPHLLVAWATWSGKSVWVNDFILSLMYQNTPSELKFLMVDPKQVELELYSWLPYLLAPIVSEPEKALKLLRRTEAEMERRFWMLKDKRVKNIDEYNHKIIAEKMFRIVFVVDELASLMMHKNKKEVEKCITHISAKARAVWIHLIIATQRPSVDVITWLIKANIPTRIAFWVVSEIDSRTIIGRKWAETLLWKWDMLYTDPNTKAPIRIQAPYVSTEEIEKVVEALRNKYMWWLTEEDIYNQEIVALLESKVESWEALFSWWWSVDDDELVEQAIQVIMQTRKASATLLQRKLNLWFARAARIMDTLEDRGVIWPQDGAKPRDIFI